MAQGMNKLNEALVSLPEVRELLLSLDAGTSPIAVSGLSGVHRAQFTAAVRHKTQRPLLIVCADENEANRMAGDLHELLGEDVSLLFAREWQLRDRVFASHGWEQQRIGSLCSLAAGKAPILVATVDGLMQRTLPPDALRGAVTDISLGDRFDLNALSKKLVESGYTRAETVEGVGQFALRGGILDVWSPLSERQIPDRPARGRGAARPLGRRARKNARAPWARRAENCEKGRRQPHRPNAAQRHREAS